MADMNIGVAGVSRGAKAGYIGVNGVARKFVSSTEFVTGTVKIGGDKNIISIPQLKGKNNFVFFPVQGNGYDKRSYGDGRIVSAYKIGDLSGACSTDGYYGYRTTMTFNSDTGTITFGEGTLLAYNPTYPTIWRYIGW